MRNALAGDSIKKACEGRHAADVCGECGDGVPVEGEILKSSQACDRHRNGRDGVPAKVQIHDVPEARNVLGDRAYRAVGDVENTEGRER